MGLQKGKLDVLTGSVYTLRMRTERRKSIIGLLVQVGGEGRNRGLELDDRGGVKITYSISLLARLENF